MANMGVNLFTSQMRISGIATGLDTDLIVSNLMKLERAPLDRLYQKRQLAQWKRDEYRNIINLLRGMKDKYFNIVKPETYMLSQSAYKKMSAVSTNSSVVTAVASAGAIPGSYKVEVIRAATAAKAESTATVTARLKSSEGISRDDILNAGGRNITVVLDGVSKEITMGNYTAETTIEEVALDLQGKIDSAFGGGKVVVNWVEEAGKFKLAFDTTGGASRITLLSGSSDDGLVYLHISPGSSNRLDTSLTLAELSSRFTNPLAFDENENLVFSINGKEFVFSKNVTLSSMMNAINNDKDANVIITYNEITDKFEITAKQLGSGENIKIGQAGGNFFGDGDGDGAGNGASGVSTVSPITRYGEDAEVKINGQSIVRSSNTFTVNGITYTVKEASSTVQTIQVSVDVDGVYEIIKGFVEEYNSMIDDINKKLNEKYDRNYLPLTEEQKEAMSEKEIELWEAKAKTGLLRNDSLLENIVFSMRKALYDKVEGVNINLAGIGITTGPYEERGKLKIDETKLKEAIASNPDAVMELFAKKSETHPSYSRTMTAGERAARYRESGLAQRLLDIIEDNISTMRNSQGKKGFLLEKAGMEGDTSEFSNMIYEEIRTYEYEIDSLYNRLIQKENEYFAKFAAMERIIGQMNAQSNWLSMQFMQFSRY
ncbi:MAG: flagellar filament capping protein FliD [Clostridiaceae bacterium]|nr:flagellar filament capping protein FliD [Clostridiaceae bacterium]